MIISVDIDFTNTSTTGAVVIPLPETLKIDKLTLVSSQIRANNSNFSNYDGPTLYCQFNNLKTDCFILQNNNGSTELSKNSVNLGVFNYDLRVQERNIEVINCPTSLSEFNLQLFMYRYAYDGNIGDYSTTKSTDFSSLMNYQSYYNFGVVLTFDVKLVHKGVDTINN